MNETLLQIFQRKSIRQYKAAPLSPDDKSSIINAAIQAPTAGNMTLYTIIDVTDQGLKDKLAITCDNQPFIAKAPMILIFCADYKRWYDVFLKDSADTRKPDVGDLFLAMSDTFIAAQNSVAAAESLGVGSCYIGDILENYETHRDILLLPKYVLPVCMLCFGYPADGQLCRRKPERLLPEDIVHSNGYDVIKSSHMTEMLTKRGHFSNSEEFDSWLTAFRLRKWDSQFSIEMSRSVNEMLKSWTE
jgi:FMN reductase (NADPH)